mmetsp:Transcript_18271/g.69171  ORF Transcript_18271/g.69171 Transcript_18271/m.69171 type:complete len:217 (+) Transcript_18271:395-1045(+)
MVDVATAPGRATSLVAGPGTACSPPNGTRADPLAEPPAERAEPPAGRADSACCPARACAAAAPVALGVACEASRVSEGSMGCGCTWRALSGSPGPAFSGAMPSSAGLIREKGAGGARSESPSSSASALAKSARFRLASLAASDGPITSSGANSSGTRTSLESSRASTRSRRSWGERCVARSGMRLRWKDTSTARICDSCAEYVITIRGFTPLQRVA